MEEEWKSIEGYEGFYEVSNLGRIKSLIGFNGHKYIKREKILSPYNRKSNVNYFKKCVKLCKNGIKKDFSVHRLVAKAFIDNPFNYKIINHIDSNPLNNKIENLEWCTQKHNVNHALKNGRKKVFEISKEDIEFEYLKNKLSVYEISKKYNVSCNTISRILHKYEIKIDKNRSKKGYNITPELLKKELKVKTQTQLSKELGCNPSNISHLLKKYKRSGLI